MKKTQLIPKKLNPVQRSLYIRVLMVLLLTITASAAHAQSFRNWNAAKNDNWRDDQNWSGAVLRRLTDAVGLFADGIESEQP